MASDAIIREQVTAIITSVRTTGDDALRAYSQQFDGVTLEDLKVSKAEIEYAHEELDEGAVNAIDVAIKNVRLFHEQQIPQDIVIETMPGVCCERRNQPIDSVGLYVPAGTAPLPSAAIMLGVPAALANCPVRVMCTPPRADGRADSAVLVAATRAGVRDIYKVGGAQAIAAMAYGTKTLPKVSKLFGPGNAYVTSAKSLVSADPDGASIDMPAGPSEVMVIADERANPAFVAADLLSQAEHGIDSQVILVTNSENFARAVSGFDASMSLNQPGPTSSSVPHWVVYTEDPSSSARCLLIS